MRRAVLMMLLLAGGAFADSVLPVCVQNTMLWYTGLDTGGCTVGPLAFKGFNFQNNATYNKDAGGNKQPWWLEKADILVTPSSSLNQSSFAFTSSKFSIGSGILAEYFIEYTIDPPPEIIDGFDISMDTNTPVYPGRADIFTSLCIGGYFSGGCPTGDVRNLWVFHDGVLPTTFASVTIIPPTDIVDVSHRIRLDTTKGGTSQIDGFGVTSTVVPEPSAALLLGTVVAALAALRTRRKRR